jgi:hypothetical protein
MPVSTSSSSAAAGGCCSAGHHHHHDAGQHNCHFVCEFQTCQMISCTPIDALPGYQVADQQLVPLPPVPRERGRSRVSRKMSKPKQPPKPSAAQLFCSPVILSTSTPADNSSNSSINGSLGNRWRLRRRRSASMRQRQGASLIRHPSFNLHQDVVGGGPLNVDNCPLCQPRYSRSPERLGLRPSPAQPHFEVSNQQKSLNPTSSYGDLMPVMTSKRPPPTRLNNKSRGRRSRSEFRPQLRLNDENVNPLNLHPNHKIKRDFNGNCDNNSDYAELSLGEMRLSFSQQQQSVSNNSRGRKNNGGRVARSKSRSKGGLQMANSGLLTIWPGKTGIWLPQ